MPETALDRPVEVTWYPSGPIDSRRLVRQETTFRALFGRFDCPKTLETSKPWADLNKAERDAYKVQIMGWSPVRFSGSRRLKADALRAHALVLDVDHADWVPTFPLLTPTKLLEVYPSTLCYIHTSSGHSPEKPKFRAVYPLAEPITAEDYETAIKGLFVRLEDHGILPKVHLDQAVTDCSRLWFVPVGLPGYEAILQDGAPMDVDRLIASAPAPMPVVSPVNIRRAQGTSNAGERFLRWCQRDLEMAGPGDKHDRLKRVAWSVGMYVGGGEIELQEAEQALWAVVGHWHRKHHQTLTYQLNAGMENPQVFEERDSREEYLSSQFFQWPDDRDGFDLIEHGSNILQV